MQDGLKELVESVTGRRLGKAPRVVTDTTRFMQIEPGDVIEIGGRSLLTLGDATEGRFGLDDEPKFWVKRCIELETGARKIVKLVFHEEFENRIGPVSFRCVRREKKEAAVLDIVRGHPNFMQGMNLLDEKGNLVRVIDMIDGESLFAKIQGLAMDHEKYMAEVFPGLLRRARDAIDALSILHERGTCHGDIRNDHLFLENGSEQLRWIDFDMDQDFSDFDVWSVGNVLAFLAAKDVMTFDDARRLNPACADTLADDDASLIFPNRVMNLRKVFPSVPPDLNEILMRFAMGPSQAYDTVSQVVSDLDRVIAGLKARADRGSEVRHG